MIRKTGWMLVWAIVPLCGIAQQKPQYTQYVFNNLLINPAVSGIENYIDVKAAYRSQWTGLDGAPVTRTLSLSAPIGNAFVAGDAVSMSSGSDNPYSPAYAASYQSAPPHHGLGLTLVADQLGYTRNTDINATYAWHLGISSDLNLSFGIAAGFDNTTLNTSAILLQQADDNAVNNLQSNTWSPDLGMGIWAYSADYYVGLSALQLLPRHLNLTTQNVQTLQDRRSPNFFATAGMRFSLSDDLAVVPSALFKMMSNLPASFDLNTKMVFDGRFWIGAAYRYRDAVGGMFGLNINSLVSLSYSYDHATSAFRSVSPSTHEIVIALMLNNRNRVICPQHTF
ncbi:type IX secretion system membrane protein PorP/SprF [Mucilaginibacter sp. BT774]|uniref:PorP/SprF family type IX secretion system membrane protein n=1 Tax=Mucilaginibacter sp. BT774 TaxID=3062276 RepID=UPI002676AAF0|nr:type IX secretion system membrane protein PorP/SprF [Mucilaginibacter sp. BT774]MDO3628859.1 type IX secretion system membrane protein PorP/SprF [Mucilaginibacter sp. BT774]